jgi:DNA polymerase-3 subunit beta
MQIDLKLLKAASFCVSKEETRYYLKGVAVQSSSDGVFIVSTDGHRAVVFRQPYEIIENLTPFNIIIPSEIIAKIKVNKYDSKATLEHIDGLRWCITHDGSGITFDVIDGTFPDWRRIVPKETSGEIAQFDLSYMADFSKVAKALGKQNKAYIAHNGNGPAIVSFGEDVEGFGLLMPFRAYSGSIITQAPSWLYQSYSEAA